MSVARAQQEIDSAEFGEWLAYAEIEPFGEDRADLRAGIVASAIYNASGRCEKETRPADFMPDFDRSRQAMQQRQSVEDMQARFRIAGAMFAGTGR